MCYTQSVMKIGPVEREYLNWLHSTPLSQLSTEANLAKANAYEAQVSREKANMRLVNFVLEQ